MRKLANLLQALANKVGESDCARAQYLEWYKATESFRSPFPRFEVRRGTPRYCIRVDRHHFILYRGGTKMLAYPKDLYTFSAACAAFEHWVSKVIGGDAGMDYLFPAPVPNVKLDNGDPDYIEVNT